MPLEEAKINAQRIVEEAWNKGNLEILDDIDDTLYVHHVPPFPDMEGIEAVKRFIVDCRNAYPDLQITIDEIVVEDNTVITRWTYQGTQTGPSPMLGIAPTGKKILFSGCNVSHWVVDKIVEEWQYADFLGLLQQLGVVPQMPPDKE